MRAAVLSAAVLSAAVLSAAPAHADLEGDAARLRAAWSKRGVVRQFRPELYERGSVRPILLPKSALGPRSECTTLAVLGAPSSNFILRHLNRIPGAEHEQLPEASVAGAVQVTRCGFRKLLLGGLAIEMRSPRGVLEVLVAKSSEPLAPLRSILKERDPGPLNEPTGPGPVPVSIPVSERARRIEERARREGGAPLPRESLASDLNGMGEVALLVKPGCERIDLLGVPTPPGAPRGVDIDAELATVDGRSTIATDTSEAADASLSACVGEASELRLRFGGSLPAAPVVLVRSRWDFPPGLSESWGPGVRSEMMSALGPRAAHRLKERPVFESLGVVGVTALPIPAEAGACYQAAVAALRGASFGMALTATSSVDVTQNQSDPSSNGTSLAFCAQTSEPVLVEVEARGAGLFWLLAVWQTSRLRLGESP